MHLYGAGLNDGRLRQSLWATTGDVGANKLASLKAMLVGNYNAYPVNTGGEVWSY